MFREIRAFPLHCVFSGFSLVTSLKENFALVSRLNRKNTDLLLYNISVNQRPVNPFVSFSVPIKRNIYLFLLFFILFNISMLTAILTKHCERVYLKIIKFLRNITLPEWVVVVGNDFARGGSCGN
jgi:hypothetical protein